MGEHLVSLNEIPNSCSVERQVSNQPAEVLGAPRGSEDGCSVTHTARRVGTVEC